MQFRNRTIRMYVLQVRKRKHYALWLPNQFKNDDGADPEGSDAHHTVGLGFLKAQEERRKEIIYKKVYRSSQVTRQ